MTSRMYEPPAPVPGLLHVPQFRPMRLTGAMVRRITHAFDATGGSFHSQGASTLQVVLDHCHATGHAYRMSGVPGGGYAVELLKAPPGGEFQADPDPTSAVMAMIRRRQSFEVVFMPGRGTSVEEAARPDAEAGPDEPAVPGMR